MRWESARPMPPNIALMRTPGQPPRMRCCSHFRCKPEHALEPLREGGPGFRVQQPRGALAVEEFNAQAPGPSGCPHIPHGPVRDCAAAPCDEVANTESFLCSSCPWQDVHLSASVARTSFSNSAPQLAHRYSYMGMATWR